MTIKKTNLGQSPSPTSPITSQEKPFRAAAALKIILGLAPEVFCNVVGTPCIRLPPTETGLDLGEWPLQSSRVRAWIGETMWEGSGIVLLEKEITRILTVLEGKAWHDQRLEWDLKDAMDQDPVLEAVVIWSEKNRSLETTQTKLLQELTKTAKKYGVDMRSKSWPKGPAQLSLRISQLIPLLLKAGVQAEIGRKSGGQRFVVLTKISKATERCMGSDDAGQAASPPASADTSWYSSDSWQSARGL